MRSSICNSLEVVQSIWLGPISVMERLAIASFVANGHEFHLYCYDEVEGLPDGATLMNAAEVLPPEWIIRDGRGSFAGFSDAFRYRLLLERGGWWVDMDMVCLRPWEIEADYFFVREPDRTISSCVVHVPPGSEVMRLAWERCQRFRPRRRPIPRRRLPWMALGPNLLGELVEGAGLSDYAVDASAFYPLDWSQWEELLEPGGVSRIDEDTKAIHLWNSMWDLAGRDKEAIYPQGSLYEQLKRRYLGPGTAAGRHGVRPS
jgi:Alpha 1,4-glycosyltransferase conserved region/Glycosyltransferase sugar-binding region containing DXD motif